MDRIEHPAYLAVAALIGFFGNCVNTIVFLNFVPRWFDRNLGLGLGVVATGIGIGQMLAPLTASALLQLVRYRNEYTVLGLGSMTLMLACALLVLRDSPLGSVTAVAQKLVDGLTHKQALRTAVFWRAVAAFVLVTAAVTGCALNIVPMLIDRGIAPASAAKLAAMTGASVLVGRLATGAALDRIPVSALARVLFAAPVVAIALLWANSSIESLYVAIILLGLALGAEGDIMAYFVRRAFGTRSYGEIYGWLWTAFSIGLLIGPVLMGASFDRFGAYDPMLAVLSIAALIAVALVPGVEDVRRSWHGAPPPSCP